jgi:uncharacterized protein YjbI with pentapeptide repeats
MIILWWVGIAAIAIIVMAGVTALWWWVPKWQMKSVTAADPKARADIEDNFRKTVGQALGGIAVLVGAGAAYYGTQQTMQASDQQSRRNLEASRALLISQQVSKGFEDLGNKESPMIVIGGIYTLEGVMQAPETLYHRPVLEALCGFVRDRNMPSNMTDINKISPKLPPTELRAALTVIGRRPADLANYADLTSLELWGLMLIGVDLRGTHLGGADLFHSVLTEADLSGADLLSVMLSGADLSDANLSNTKMFYTDLSNANLFRANLTGANLSVAKLWGADLTEADLTDARGLTQDQLDSACGTNAKLPTGLTLKKPCPRQPAPAVAPSNNQGKAQ